MGKQRIISIQLMCHCIKLMRAECDVRCHAGEFQMRTVIFPRSGGIEYFIIFFTKHLPAVRITEYPVLKGFPYCFLFLAGKHGFLFI